MCFCVLLYFTACVLYYCNTVGWAWWDWGLIWWLTILLQCFDIVGWVTWPVKISSPNDLYCVEWDVKPYSTQLNLHACVHARDGHFEDTLWPSVCLLCTWWILCFTPCLMQHVHYKSMKCDVSFSQGNISTIFRWGGHFHTCLKNFFLLTTVQKL